MSESPSTGSLRLVAQNAAWIGGAGLAVKPIWFAFITVLCARVLGAEGYGALTTAMSLVAIAFSFTGWGVETYVVREVAADPGQAPRMFASFLGLRVALAALAVLGAATVGLILDYGAVLTGAVVVACAYQALTSLTVYVQGYFQALERMRTQGAVIVVERTLTVVLGAAALLWWRTPSGALAGMAGGAALAAALALSWLRRVVPVGKGQVDVPFVRRALRPLAPFAAAGFLGVLFFRVDTVMIEGFLGEAEAGRYGLAFRVVEALSMVFLAVNSAMYPRLSKLMAEGARREFWKVVAIVTTGMTVMCAAIALAVALFARPAIAWAVADPKLLASASILVVLCWSLPLTAVRTLFDTVLVARGDQRFVALALAVAVAANVVSNAVLIPHPGLDGRRAHDDRVRGPPVRCLHRASSAHARLRRVLMRVLTVVLDLDLGGVQRGALDYARGFAQQGHASAVLTALGGGPREATVDPSEVTLFLGAPGDDQAARAAAAWRPDLVHIHSWGPLTDPEGEAVEAVLRHCAVRPVVIETASFAKIDYGQRFRVTDVYLLLSRWALWRWQRWTRPLSPRPLGVVVPITVDPATFYPDPGRFRVEHGIPADAVLLGSIGRPIPSSGIRSCSTRPSRSPGSGRRSTWSGWDRPTRRRAAWPARLPTWFRRTTVLPVVTDDASLRHAYSALDVFLHASPIGETFGLVFVEALACGTPVATLATPHKNNSQLEVVGHERGGLVAADERSYLANVLRLVEDAPLRTRLGTQGRTHTLQSFTLDRVIPTVP